MRSKPAIFFRYVAIVFLFIALSSLASEVDAIGFIYMASILAMIGYLMVSKNDNFPKHLTFILLPPLFTSALFVSKDIYAFPDGMPIAYFFLIVICVLGAVFTSIEAKRAER